MQDKFFNFAVSSSYKFYIKVNDLWKEKVFLRGEQFGLTLTGGLSP